MKASQKWEAFFVAIKQRRSPRLTEAAKFKLESLKDLG